MRPDIICVVSIPADILSEHSAVHVVLTGSSEAIVAVGRVLVGGGHTVTLSPDHLVHPGVEPGDDGRPSVLARVLPAGTGQLPAPALHPVPPAREAARSSLGPPGHVPLLNHGHPRSLREPRPPGREARYRPSERIHVQDGWPMEVRDGAIALTALHADTTEVIVGVAGPGDYLLHHPSDTCSIEAIALTPVVCEVVSWDGVAAHERFAASLASRVLRSQAWAAAQAHPYIEQRLLGILNVLSEQFGDPRERGRVITIRLTHSQLAAITGTTRPTVTRAIATLCQTGHLGVVGTGNHRRLCVYSSRI